MRMPMLALLAAVLVLAPTLAQAKCKGGWKKKGDMCYKTFDTKKSWNDANKDCQTQAGKGGRLATVHDKAEFTTVANLVKGKKTEYWIGAKALQPKKSKKTSWTDKSSFEGAWFSNEPNDKGAQTCGRITDGKLKDKSCGVKFGYICEVSGEAEKKPTTGNPDGKCPGGWKKYGGMCFKRFGKKEKWDSAEKQCNKYGGHLATIRDSGTLKFLTGVIKRSGDTWVGSQADLKKGKTTWSDGSPWKFDAWGDKEPNEKKLTTSCGRITKGNMRDKPCNKKYGFMCEKAAGTGETCKVRNCVQCKSGDPKKCDACDPGFKVNKNRRKCRRASAAGIQCTGKGDVHYYSFDGAKIDFQGDCQYQLVKTINLGGNLVAIDIQVSSKKRHVKDRVSFVRDIILVYGTKTFIFSHKKGLIVDGTQVNTGYKDAAAGINIAVNGDTYTMTTTSGFTLKYDRATDDKKGSVTINLPEQYAGKTEGICGNSNGNKADDEFAKGGNKKVSDAEVGDSWKIPNADKRPACKTNTPPDACPKDKEQTATQICNNLFKHAVMTDCMGIIKEADDNGEEVVQGHLADCIYDLCRTADPSASTCSAAEGLVEKCQALSTDVIDWREAFNCPMPCPARSTYKLDVTLCDATCLNPEPKEDCQDLPTEGCPCDEGFVRSDGDCIPVAKCGCTITMKGNKIYKSVGSKWISDDCKYEYTCDAKDKVSQKRLKKCHRRATCGIKNGVRGCVCKEGFSGDGFKCWGNRKCECTAAGDAHFHTCDNQWVHFQGDCSYIAAETCAKDGSVEPFQVITDLHKFPSKPKVSYVRSVYVTVYGITINMLPDKILVDGLEASAPLSLNDNKLKLKSSGSYLTILTEFGLVVKYGRMKNQKNKYALEIPKGYANKLCGICGNYNGDKKDDLFPKGSKEKAKYGAIGDSWITANPLDDVCQSTTKEEPEDECNEVKETTKGFTQCNELIKAEVFEDCTNVLGEDAMNGFLESCVFDACKTDAIEFSVCDLAQTVVDECNKNMETPVDWREAFKCPMACDKNSEYSHNIVKCEASCQDRNPEDDCYEKPIEGCACVEGFVRSGDNCVPVSECGCLEKFEGNLIYHEKDQVWNHKECNMTLRCDGELVVEEDGCGENANCVGEEGSRECKCDKGFEGDGFICEEVCTDADVNCAKCDKKNKCKNCKDKHQLDDKGVCKLCDRENCEECNKKGECKKCADGFKKNKKGNCQGPCAVELCDECEVDKTKECKKCAGKAKRDDKGLCIEECTSSTKNCAVCDPDDISKCKACKPKFWLDEKKNACKKCTLKNCFECESADRCKSCDEDFFVDASGQCQPKCTKKDKLCKFCDTNKQDQCLICKPPKGKGKRRYLDPKGVCKDCKTKNCLICNDGTDGECHTCDTGYVVRDGQCSLVCTRRDENCKLCDEELLDVCTQCKKTHFIVGDGTGLCQECTKENCQKCGSDGSCEKCAKGFFIKDGECIEECTNRDLQCTKCNKNDKSQCKECKKGRSISDEDGKCRKCEVKDCKECNGAGKCKECEENFVKSKDGLCKENCLLSDANCGECKKGNEQQCKKCADDRFYLNDKGVCVECNPENCQLCKKNGKCKVCDEGFDLNKNGNCQGPCAVKFCKKCVLDDNESCDTCGDGFEKKGSLCVEPCTKSIEFCLECDEGDVETCKVCTDGYFRADEGHCAQCDLPGCDECDDGGETCKTCGELYFKNKKTKQCDPRCTTRDANCAECKRKDPGACKQCSEGSVMTKDGTCQVCDLGNCEKCNPDLTCKKCAKNYFIAKDGTCQADCTLLDENCRKCDKKDNSACAACKDDFFVGDEDQRCHACQVSDCDECDTSDTSGETCKDCAKDFFVNDLKQCQETCQKKDKRCEECADNAPDTCVRCKEGMFVDDASKRCEGCKRKKCKQCDGVGRCDSCVPGFEVNDNGNCQEPCNLPNCKECVLDNSKACKTCDDNFLVDEKTKRCVPACQVASCVECEAGNPFLCTKCDADNFLDLDKQCQECSRGEACVRCNQDSTCAECSGDFFVNKVGNCQETCAKDENCEKCSKKDNSKCDKCKGDMYVQKETGQCVPCTRDNCKQCSPDGTCSKCDGTKKEFFVNKEGDCQAPCTVDENCQACKANDKSRCNQCVEGFYADKKTGACKECAVENCVQCKPDGTCRECAKGTKLEKGTCQEPCEIPQCNKCVFNDVSKCEKCQKNFKLNPLTADCYEDCKVKNCDQCASMEPFQCDSCAKDFYLNAKKQCKKCNKKNCDKCAPDGSCADCKSGFDVTEKGACDPICELAKCLKCNTKGKCVKCEEGYKIRKGECTPKCNVPKCDTCNTKGECVECSKNFDVVEGKCKRVCNDPNCLKCKDDGVCNKCPDDMFMAKDKSCKPCERENCVKCNNKGECAKCTKGYMKDKKGGCTPECKVPKCDLCDLQGNCEKCQDNSIKELGACKPCDKANCKHCAEEGPCDECKKNYRVGAKGECEPVCDVKDCTECKKPNQCKECMYGFYLKGKQCKECKIRNCEDCSNAKTCKTCVKDYELTKKNQCKPRCELDNCDSCKAPDVCGKCAKDYKKDGDGCKPVCKAKKCLSCSAPKDCDSCETGFRLMEDKSCKVICEVENCDDCKTADRCKSCSFGYVIDKKTGRCKKTPCKVKGCEECELGSKDTCTKCAGDKELMKDGKECKQPCDVVDCKKCEDGERGTCKKCVKKMVPTGDGSKCEEPCAVENCEQCVDGDPKGCKKCAGTLVPSKDTARCEEPCSVDLCVECEIGEAAVCKVCRKPLVPNDDNSACIEPCNVGNCDECAAGDPDTCKACEDDLTFNVNTKRCEEPCKVENCDACEEGDPDTCQRCAKDMAPNADTGECEVPCNVDDCDDCGVGKPDICTKCAGNKMLMRDGQACEEPEAPCEVRDCDECEKGDPGSCKTCSEGMVPNDDNSECKAPCNVEDCEVCTANNPESCDRCDEGLQMTRRFPATCEEPKAECVVADCDECKDDNPKACENCAEGMEANEKDQCEVPCDVKDCQKCVENDPNTCNECPEGMALNDDNTGCEAPPGPCNVKNCDACAEGNDKQCDVCTEGFMPQGGGKSCEPEGPAILPPPVKEPCEVDNCEECETADRCKVCAGDMVVNEDSGQCEEACQAADCMVCEEGSQTRCEMCQGDMTPNRDGQCEPPPGPCNVENCDACAKDNDKQCDVCTKGFMPQSGGKSCEPEGPEVLPPPGKEKQCIVPNCVDCFPEDETFCAECEEGFTVSKEGKCEDDRTPCENQASCHEDATCDDGFCECNPNLCGDGVNTCKDRCICRLEGDPLIKSYDKQELLLTGTHKYTLTKDMVNASDPCSFNVEVKVTPLVRQQRVQYATTMPRFIDIDILGFSIHLGQNHKAFVAEKELDISTGVFNGEGFVIRDQRDPNNPAEDFIVFDSKECGIVIGFYGNALKSVAIVDIPCKYGGSGRLIGLCGDCDGRANDLRTLDGTDVSGRPNMFAEISESYVVDEAIDHQEEVDRGIL